MFSRLDILVHSYKIKLYVDGEPGRVWGLNLIMSVYWVINEICKGKDVAMSTGYHEENLSASAKDIHRALASLQEELEAVDWYHQRADVTTDESLKAILEHNRNEEIEHACMALEYLRRNFPEFDEELRTYLFKTEPITELEELAEAEENGEAVKEEGRSGAKGLGIGKNG